MDVIQIGGIYGITDRESLTKQIRIDLFGTAARSMHLRVLWKDDNLPKYLPRNFCP